MNLLIIGIVSFISILLYFIWYDIKADVFPRLYFEDYEKVDLNGVKFVKVFPKN